MVRIASPLIWWSKRLAAGGLLGLSACQGDDARFDASGNFEATETVVAAQASGPLVRFTVVEGDTLGAGREVGLIDTTQLHFKRVQLLASVRAVGQRIPAVPVQLRALEQQRANQLRERARTAALVRTDVLPRVELDRIDYQIAVLDKQLAAQQASLRTQVQGTAAEADPLRAQLAQVADQLRKSRILNPVPGTVLTRYVEPSELVSYGQPLYRVADLRQLVLRAYVSGDQLARVRLGQQVRVLVDAPGGQRRTYAGRVAWVADRAEFTPKVIQTKEDRVNLVYALKIDVVNADGALKIGMPADVLL